MYRFAFQLRELVLCIFLMFTVFTTSVVMGQAVAGQPAGARTRGGEGRKMGPGLGRPRCAHSDHRPSHARLRFPSPPVNCTVGTTDDTQGGDAALRRCASASGQLLVTSAATAVVVPPELTAQAAVEGDE